MFEKIRQFWENFKNYKISLEVLNFLLYFGFAYFIFSMFLNIIYKERFLPNTFIGELNFGSVKIVESENYLKKLDENLKNKNINFNIIINDKKIAHEIGSSFLKVNLGNYKNVIKETTDNQNIFNYPIKYIQSLFFEKDLSGKVLRIDSEKVEKNLNQKLSDMSLSKLNYDIEYINNEFVVSDGHPGFSFDFKKDITYNDEIEKSVLKEDLYSEVTINLEPTLETEDITKSQAEEFILNNKDKLSKIATKNLYHARDDVNYKNYLNLSQRDIFDILKIELENNKIVFKINKEKLDKKIVDLKAQIQVDPTDEIFTLSPDEKKVTNYLKAVNGKKIDMNFLINDLENSIYLDMKSQQTDNKIKIIMQVAEAKSGNKFGIKELLGTGYSSFKGSDSARYHNIMNALSKIDGSLIAPNETFSLSSALAPFDYESGYTDGLVIKGKKIIPEIGGGMCQLGTTLFRAAMNSGIEIKERTNHSLWVSWYNDPKNGNPGTDATIYADSPDLKITNDTKNYIMIDVKVSNNGELYMELWGTSDGRSGSYSPPRVIKYYPAPKEAKINYLTELEPGRKICNGPFKGASTVFTYYVKDSSGKVNSRNFYSYYRPQELICQVGI